MTKIQSFLVAFSSHSTAVLVMSKLLWIPLMVVLLILLGLNLLPKDSAWLLILGYIALAAAYVAITAWAKRMRERHIREAPFPRFLKAKLLKAYPHLTSKDYDLVERGMRQYFLACARSKKQFVAMPSKAVDALWHEFILHTKNYQAWCNMALGYFLHHTPAAALGKQAKNNDGLRRAWYWACKDEAINPKSPGRLPLLFALDMKLAIEGGYSYVPDCKDIVQKSAAGSAGVAGGGAAGSDPYCGNDFYSGSYSSDSSSTGDFGGADASSSGGASSDGGSGDGGGCGGCGGGGD